MAGRIALDLKQFSHVKSDKDSTTLRHKQGHLLKLAHKALSKDARAQLESFCSGGEVHYDEGGKVQMPAQNDPAPTKSTTEKPIRNQWDAGGGFSGALDNAKKELFGKAEGGPVGLDPQDSNKVPTPGSGANDSNDAKQRLRDVSKGAEKHPQEGKSVGDILSDAAKNWWDPEKKAEGGQVKMAEGGPPNPAQAAADNMPESVGHWIGQHGVGPVLEAIANTGKMAMTVGKGAMDVGKGVLKGTQETPVGQDLTNALKEDEPAPAPAPAQAQEVAQMQPQQEEPVRQSAPALAPMPEPKSSIPSQETLFNKAYNTGNAGIQAAANAQQTLGDQEANLQSKQATADQDALANYKSTVDSLNNERMAHIKDIQNGYVDPNKYWAGYTASNGDQIPGHSKVAAAIGLILGGLNPTANHTAAIDILNNNINMSLQSQAKNLDSQHNLLRANLEQFHNMRDAADATRLMMGDALSHQLAAAASKAKGPMAQAAAQQAQAQLAQSLIPIAQQLQMRQTLQKISNGGQSAAGTTGAVLNQLDAVNPEAAKAYRGRYFSPFDQPGGKSLADRELPPAVIDQLNSHAKFDQAANNLKHLVEQNRGNMAMLLDPTNPTSKLAAQQAMILQSLFREGTLGTVYREGEQPLLDKAIKGNPLSLLSYFSEIPKLQGLIESNKMMRDQTAAGYGLRPPQDKTQSIQPQVVTGKDGRQYRRVGQFMVPVK